MHTRVVSVRCRAQRHKVLVTLGRDDASAGSTSLKLWGLDGVRAGGAPACQRTLRCFAPAGKTPEVRQGAHEGNVIFISVLSGLCSLLHWTMLRHMLCEQSKQASRDISTCRQVCLTMWRATACMPG